MPGHCCQAPIGAPPAHPAASCSARTASRTLHLFLPFIALQNLAEAAGRTQARLPSLKTVVTAGEQLRIGPAIGRLFEQNPGCRLHNHYGPTETTGTCARWTCADGG